MSIEKQLRAYLKSRYRKRFEWGQHDCVLFCLDWIDYRTGSNHAAKWRGTYDSLKTADKRIEDEGQGSLIICASKMLGEDTAMFPADAMRGDVGIIMTDLGETCAIKDVHGWWVVAKNGCILCPTGQNVELKAWRIE